jgi:hypothetical protein
MDRRLAAVGNLPQAAPPPPRLVPRTGPREVARRPATPTGFAAVRKEPAMASARTA